LQSADVSLIDGLISTRAIRRYTDEPIPDRVLRDILFVATRAPSGSNRQPFRFLVLTDSPTAVAAKRLIADVAQRVWAAKRERDGYTQGSAARPDSPKSRMAGRGGYRRGVRPARRLRRADGRRADGCRGDVLLRAGPEGGPGR